MAPLVKNLSHHGLGEGPRHWECPHPRKLGVTRVKLWVLSSLWPLDFKMLNWLLIPLTMTIDLFESYGLLIAHGSWHGGWLSRPWFLDIDRWLLVSGWQLPFCSQWNHKPSCPLHAYTSSGYFEKIGHRLWDNKLYANGENDDFVWHDFVFLGHVVMMDGI